MRTPPDDLDDHDVAAGLALGWGATPTAVAYAAIGFGDHHWWADLPDGGRWFLTLARPDGGRDTAYRAAAALRHRAGLEFVVAPVRNRDGGVLSAVGRGYVMAVTPWLEHAEDRADPDTVAGLAARLHGATEAVRDLARTDDLALDARVGLESALADLDRPWDPGAYAEDVRSALRARAGRVRAALAAYDDLVARVRGRAAPPVITHGELKAGNVLATPAGPAVVDWDTVLLAPPERDLWRLAAVDPDAPARYTALTGRPVDPDALALYRTRWDLTDLAQYVTDLRAAPARTADTEVAWTVLRSLLA